MKTGIKIFLGVVAFIVLMLGLTLGFGWFGVYQTKTVGKAQMNANREVFEQTQSYVEGKRQELSKLHREWIKSDNDGKLAIESTVRFNFASFSEEKYLQDSPDLYNWLRDIKNK